MAKTSQRNLSFCGVNNTKYELFGDTTILGISPLKSPSAIATDDVYHFISIEATWIIVVNFHQIHVDILTIIKESSADQNGS